MIEKIWKKLNNLLELNSKGNDFDIYVESFYLDSKIIGNYHNIKTHN